MTLMITRDNIDLHSRPLHFVLRILNVKRISEIENIFKSRTMLMETKTPFPYEKFFCLLETPD
jgi:hypothetical protein